MAKTQFKSNLKGAQKKIDEDLEEINLAVASATTILINVAMKDAHDRRILDGTGHKAGRAYLEVPGTNLGTKKDPKRKTFHKLKVVTRDGSMYKAFKQVPFKKHRIQGSKGKIYSGSNGVANVEVLKKGLGQVAWIEWGGKIGQSLRNLEFGVSSGTTIMIKNDRLKKKENKRKQRKIASGALRAAVSRFKKLGQDNLNKALKRRNKVKIK